MRVVILKALKWRDIERRREGGIDVDRVRAPLRKNDRSERRCRVKVDRGSNGSNEPGQPESIIFLWVFGLFEREKCGYKQDFWFSAGTAFINKRKVFRRRHICWISRKSSIQENGFSANEIEDEKEGQYI